MFASPMFEKILQLLFITCRHSRTSQPFSAATTTVAVSDGPWESVGAGSGHYIVCLECGKKFNYDWNEMRVVS